jgi:RHS repeat-associated protein
LGKKVKFGYDANGFVRTQTDERNNPSATNTYNAIGRLETTTDALTKLQSLKYNPGGLLRERIDRKGQLASVVYDGLGRTKRIGFGASAAAPTAYKSVIELSWDNGNRLVRIDDKTCANPGTQLDCASVASTRTITRVYDELDRMTQETTPQGEVNYTYDKAGRRETMVVRNGAPGSQTKRPTITYVWDDADRLTQIKQAAGSANNNVEQIIKLKYDDANRRQRLTLANGSTVDYDYDDADQLKTLSFKRANGTVIGDLSYTYDKAGRRTSMGGSLARVNLPALSLTDTNYNAANRLTRWAGKDFSYDFNGNLTADGTSTYQWDERDQLKGVSNGATALASFSYDAAGRRSAKTVGAMTTGFVYDGLNFVQELSRATNTSPVLTNLLASPDTLDEIFLREEGSVLQSVLADANNNTVRLMDQGQAKLVDYSYQPYGVSSADTTNTNAQQFTGRENDNPGNTNGLYYYRARYYMPGCARFISEDPIGWASGQTNNYAYVGGDPVSFTDPEGFGSLGGCVADQFGITDIVAAAAAVSGAPVIPKPFSQGGSRFTSPASKYLSKWFPQKIPSTWAPTAAQPLARTAVLGRALGRWIPIIGTAVLAYDVASVVACTID